MHEPGIDLAYGCDPCLCEGFISQDIDAVCQNVTPRWPLSEIPEFFGHICKVQGFGVEFLSLPDVSISDSEGLLAADLFR